MPVMLGKVLALRMLLGRTGHGWEEALLGQAASQSARVDQCRTVVDLLVHAEVEPPALIVVGEDFPRLAEAVGRLRGISPVRVVGRGPNADLAPDRIDLGALLADLDIPAGRRGRLVTVWGPHGSYGSTSVAIGLARGLSGQGGTLLLDANVHAPSVADEMGLPLGGLLQACVAADRGVVDLPTVQMADRLAVLTGLDPGLYPAAHPGALHQVLDAARARHAYVVADVDSAVDPAGEIGLVPDWTTATGVCLQAADDVVIVVGEGSQPEQRLWRSLPAVADLLRGRATVVVNRCRDPKRTTERMARRLGDYLPEAAVGWIGSGITTRSLAPIVAELAAGASAEA